MTDPQWEELLAVVRGEKVRPLPTGFIIDCPWLPNWAGHSILDYFASEKVWLEDNLKAALAFPQTMFLPGFWPEYGMCTEPSAFGAACVWGENEFPFAKKMIHSAADSDRLDKPDVRKDGLLPLAVKRLQRARGAIEKAGHKVRFAVARGPLNIASFLMGTTEFLTAIKTDAGRMHRLLAIVTDFLIDWISYQRECFPTIDGILLLDDIVGFIGKNDFLEFGLPHLKRAYASDVSVKFFHNDAACRVCAPFLPEAGVNLLNFGPQHSMKDMKEWTGNRITLLGNIPPRDVLAQGTPGDVEKAVRDMLGSLSDTTRIIPSCGGGMPPGAPTANIQAFIRTVEELSR